MSLNTVQVYIHSQNAPVQEPGQWARQLGTDDPADSLGALWCQPINMEGNCWDDGGGQWWPPVMSAAPTPILAAVLGWLAGPG